MSETAQLGSEVEAEIEARLSVGFHWSDRTSHLLSPLGEQGDRLSLQHPTQQGGPRLQPSFEVGGVRSRLGGIGR